MSRSELDEARRVGERLQAEFRALVRSFPREARTIVQMSEWLGITRPVCQRLVRAVRHRGDAITAMTYFPGVRGLHQIVAAGRRQGCDGALLAVADAAVEQYSTLIDEHGGSQARLISALESSGSPSPEPASAVDGDDGLLAVRRTAFESLRQITGREFQTQVAVFLYRPREDDPGRMEVVTAMGMIGVRRSPGALPICPLQRFSEGSPEEIERAHIHVGNLGDDPVATGAPVAVLEAFCSRPLPAVVARQIDGRIAVLIDPDRAAVEPFDIVLGTYFKDAIHPACDDPKVQLCSLVSDGPARDLLICVYLHRSLAQASIPSVATFALGNRGPVAAPDTGQHSGGPIDPAAERWFDRLPASPRLEHLGIGLEHTETPVYSRIVELTEHLCSSRGWPPEEFVGYRCHVAYPIWGVQHVVSFDFGDGDPA